jgi:hypothetical protein
MFFPGSRYEKAETYTLSRADGSKIKVVKLPLPTHPAVLGFHPRLDGQRLDLLANFYLKDATTFWRLCDANNAQCPDALAAHGQIGIPPKAG